MILRSQLLAASLNLRGVPYLWGAKGPTFFDNTPTPQFALDCSGAYTYAVQQAGGQDLRLIANTDVLWNKLPEVTAPQPGDAAFYGGTKPDDVGHIEMVIAVVDGMVVVGGSSGGDSKTTTLEIARTRRAMYKVKATHLYRADFRGFRSAVPLLTRTFGKVV